VLCKCLVQISVIIIIIITSWIKENILFRPLVLLCLSIVVLVYLCLVFQVVDIYMPVVECWYVPFFADVLSIYSCILLFFCLKGKCPTHFLYLRFLSDLIEIFRGLTSLFDCIVVRLKHVTTVTFHSHSSHVPVTFQSPTHNLSSCCCSIVTMLSSKLFCHPVFITNI
jgi:hypothetical protein